MPRLVRLYIVNVAFGFAIAGAFVAMLMWFDVAHLRHLVATSDMGWLALAVLWVLNGIIFAGAQFGIAVMRMADDGSGTGGQRDPVRHAPLRLRPVPVPPRKKTGPRRPF